MKDYIIRKALPNRQDARGLHHVEQVSLGDSPYGPDRISRILNDPNHLTWVAVSQSGDIVGFCDCFVTLRPTPCLEIDLLGVLPLARNQGLATRMIHHARQDAKNKGITTLRALVATDNIASRRAFEKAGLKINPGLYKLLVYETGSTVLSTHTAWNLELLKNDTLPQPTVPLKRLSSPDFNAWADTLCVHTVSYDGLWLEDVRGENEQDITQLLRAAISHAQRLELDEVGRIHPASDTSSITSSLFRAGFSSVGEYYVLSD